MNPPPNGHVDCINLTTKQTHNDSPPFPPPPLHTTRFPHSPKPLSPTRPDSACGRYQCNVDGRNVRRDRDMRPELCKGTVDFLATKEYSVRPPQEPIFVFVLDSSTQALQRGVLNAEIAAIRGCLEHPRMQNPRVRVGIMSFNQTVQFYGLKGAGSEPHVLIMADTNDPFAPLPPNRCVSCSVRVCVCVSCVCVWVSCVYVCVCVSVSMGLCVCVSACMSVCLLRCPCAAISVYVSLSLSRCIRCDGGWHCCL